MVGYADCFYTTGKLSFV